MTDWANESLYPGWGQRFAVSRRLVTETTAFQSIEVIDTASHGPVTNPRGLIFLHSPLFLMACES